LNISTIVNKYREKIKDDKIFFAPYIPNKKLRNAMNSYASGVNAAEVLLLVDNTVFGSAKAGMLITTSCIYFAEPFGESQFLDTDKIISIDADFGIVSTDISFNNGKQTFFLNQISNKKIKILVELLRELICSSNFEPEIQEVSSINKKANLECRGCGAQIPLSVSKCEYCETSII